MIIMEMKHVVLCSEELDTSTNGLKTEHGCGVSGSLLLSLVANFVHFATANYNE